MIAKAVKSLTRRALQGLGYEIVSKEDLERMRSFIQNQHPIGSLWSVLEEPQRNIIGPFMGDSKAQLAQDLFVLSELGQETKHNYFVEFGATDGLSLSNTWLLERKLGWNGILAEPAKSWQAKLRSNRNCQIDSRCVSDRTGEVVEFTETLSAELSGMSSYLHTDDWAANVRSAGRNLYSVETVSLNDLLAHYEAPKEMGYLSIDTEGSEYIILAGFDFERWKFKVVTVEHNCCEPARSKIRELFLSNGYRQRHAEISKWDDWYVAID